MVCLGYVSRQAGSQLPSRLAPQSCCVLSHTEVISDDLQTWNQAWFLLFVGVSSPKNWRFLGHSALVVCPIFSPQEAPGSQVGQGQLCLDAPTLVNPLGA